MKNIYLTMIMLVSFAWASAQLTPSIHEAGDAKLHPMDQTSSNAFAKSHASTKGTETAWFHQPSAFSDLYLGANFTDFYGFGVFPDSTMLYDGSGDGSHIFNHQMGIIMDPVSEVFQMDVNNWNVNTAMTMDSVAIGISYSRNTASTVVDTIVMQVQVNTWGWSITEADASWVQTVYGVSEMYIGAILHEPLSWDARGNSDANVIKTLKFPLTEADTTGANLVALYEKAVTGVSLAADEKAKVTFTFIPGYSWTPNVDSIQMYNELQFTSYGESSVGGFPFYASDMNSNHILRTFAYRDATDDVLEAAYFFATNPYYYQYHNVYFQFTALNTSIETAAAELNVSQNRPNPFTGNTTIDYTLENTSNVNVTIYNVAGAQVMNINKGLQAAGSHNLSIDGSNLQAGVYYYTFTVDNNSVTKKMIVY